MSESDGELSDGEVDVTMAMEEPNDDDIAMEVECGEETLNVTYRSMKHLEMAMDASANQPTYFFKCKYVIDSVCSILEEEALDYLFPGKGEQADQAAEFDWNGVQAGRKETYPPSRQPSEEEFATVRTIYNVIKDKKDDRARANGMPNSGIQKYKTFKAKWSSIRAWGAIYDELMKESSQQMKMDKMTADLKLCRSEKHIDEKISTEIMRHVSYLKRQAMKKRKQDDIAKEIADLESMKVNADKEVEKVQKKMQVVADKKVKAVDRLTRSGDAVNNALAAIRREEKETKNTRKDAIKAQKSVVRELKNAQKQRNVIEKAAAVPETKKKKTALRNDLTLVNEITSPRQKVELDGIHWQPPIRGNNNVFEAPGEDWKKASIEKVKLLVSLHRHLMDSEAIERTLTFQTTMEYCGLDNRNDYEYAFADRVYIHLVALYLYEHL